MNRILPPAILALQLLTSDAIAAAAPKYDLAHVDGIESFGGSIAAQKLLANNGFVVAAPDFAQIFEPYIKSPLPVFITPDSAWHTYHFLLEQAVKELEGVQAERLRNFSRALHAAAEDQSAKGQAEFRELARYVAVALAFQDPDFAAQLSREDRQIVEALVSGQAPVTVSIGFPLNPVLFRPESFYTQSEALKTYFRARQWYALVDFRPAADHELDLAILLSWLIDSRVELHDAWTQLTRPLDTMVAVPEDLTISNVAPELRAIKNSGGDLSTVRGQLPAIKKRLRSNAPHPRINDQLLERNEYAQFGDVTAGFRILPARQLPCAILFQNSVDPKIPRRLGPSGLDFFAGAAALRSPAATRAEETQFGKAVLKAVIQADPGPLPSTLYGQSLTLLTTLQKPLPPTTAAPMRSEAWSDLQLWAQLGAWAELRHTWALHAKPGECIWA